MKFKIFGRLAKDLQVSVAGVKEGIEQLAEKADLKMQVTKLSLSTSDIEERLEAAYRALGDLAYRDAPARPADFYDRPEVREAMQGIRRVQVEAQSLERQIARLQEGRAEEVMADAAGFLKEAEWTVDSYEVAGGSPADGARLSSSQIPPDMLVIAVIRAGAYELPKGNTVLQPGDHVTVVSRTGEKKTIEHWMTGD